MWSGCKHRHEVEERDYKQVWSPWGCPDRLTGEEGREEGGGEWWFGLLLFTPLPSTTSLLPAALSFGLSRYNWKSSIDRSTTMKQETDKQADKCTWRLKSWKTAETHQFVNSTIFNRVITFPPSRSQSLCFSFSIVHYFEGTGREATLISSSRMVKGDHRLLLMPNKSNWIPCYHFFFQMNQKLVLIPVKLSSIYLYPVVILSSLFISYWSRNN